VIDNVYFQLSQDSVSVCHQSVPKNLPHKKRRLCDIPMVEPLNGADDMT